ncbi:MAG TPA: hypothetical protein VLJ15_00170 [Gammaproteobacteria bacterium]|nr:hypothetical protein [Gammaproteobacteria bacterium]
MSQTRTPLTTPKTLEYYGHEGNFMTATGTYDLLLTQFDKLVTDRKGKLMNDLDDYCTEYETVKPSIETEQAALKSLQEKGKALQARLTAATQKKEDILKMRVPTEDELLGLYRRHGLDDAKVERNTLIIKNSYLASIKIAQNQRKIIADEDPNDEEVLDLAANIPLIDKFVNNLTNIIKQQNLTYPAPGTVSSGPTTFTQSKSPAAPKAAAPANVSPVLQPRPGGFGS